MNALVGWTAVLFKINDTVVEADNSTGIWQIEIDVLNDEIDFEPDFIAYMHCLDNDTKVAANFVKFSPEFNKAGYKGF